MDYGRSCYKVDMDFAGDGSRIRKVRWYFADDNARTFPGPHRFGSRNWQPIPRQTLGCGEVWYSDRTYDLGTRPPGALGRGQFCGDLSWWMDGVPADAPDLELGPSGLGKCCPQDQGVAVGGRSYRRYQAKLSAGALLGGLTAYRLVRSSLVGLRAGAVATSPAIGRSALVGGFAGGQSTLRTLQRLTGTIGLKAGLVGVPRPHYLGLVGLKAGLVGVINPRFVQRLTGTIGLKGGLVGVPRETYPGRVGLEAGLVGAQRPRIPGSIGIAAGLVGVPHGPTLQHGSIGMSAGLQGTIDHGIQTQCCPGNLISDTLFGTTNGKPSTYVWTSGLQGWQWVDPDTGQNLLLQCQHIQATVYQFRLNATPNARCIKNHTLHSLTCSPFQIDIEVSNTGVFCESPGDWRAILHA